MESKVLVVFLWLVASARSDGEYSAEEQKCLSERKFWAEGSCHSVPSKGPCPEGRMLLINETHLQETGLYKPVCLEKRCSAADELWWSKSNQCRKKSDIKKECGDNKQATLDVFGEGTCTCIGTYAEMDDGKCFEYYQKGPCSSREVITYDSKTGYGKCSPDKCNKKNSMSRRRMEYAPLEGVGQCYKLNGAEPCTIVHNQSRFTINQFSKVPRCSEPTIGLHIIDAPVFCRLDQNNVCRNPVEVEQEDRLSFLMQQRNEYRKRKRRTT